MESSSLGIKGQVLLLLDTGASATIILDRDRERLGLDWDRLVGSDHQLGGIGGVVETRLIPNGHLSFASSSGRSVKERTKIYVARHDLKGLARSLKRSIMFMPSLLGRDLIERYRFVYDKSKGQVYLER